MQNHTAVNIAQVIILKDLVDALLFEGIAGIVSNSETTKGNGQTLLIYERETQRIKIPVYFSALNIFHYESSQPTTIEGKASKQSLTAAGSW